MNDLYEALKMAIHNYMYVDKLPLRRQKKIKDSYARHTYDFDSVESLSNFNKEDTESEI